MTIKAKFVKNLESFTGQAKLYKLSKPVFTGYKKAECVQSDHVVVSATSVASSGLETYIFLTDCDGLVLSWSELPGSFQGGLDHERAIKQAGWELVED